MYFSNILSLLLLTGLIICDSNTKNNKEEEEPVITVKKHEDKASAPPVSPLTYDASADPIEEPAKESDDMSSDYKDGSICVYCKYCKLCDLCEKSCPCKKNDNEHCDMCKYCKYCSLCGTVCDSVCNPGGFLDTFTSAVYDLLPSFNKKTREEMERDMEKAKDFIKEYL